MKSRLILPVLSAVALCVTGARAQSLQFDASFPRAFHQWNTTGFSADIGGVFAQNFVGFEWTYFNPKGSMTVPVLGLVNTNETVNLVQLVDRYSVPIGVFGKTGNFDRVELYFGGGLGLGLIRQSVSYVSAIPALNGLGAGAATDLEICYEAVAGVQVYLMPNIGLKLGFRYIDSVNNVRQFNSDANTDTKTLEAGVTCRF